jgi:DNA helicase-2/ATP-dependent DNA helicase PcrA
VADRVLDYRERGIALKSQAVLFRSSSHSAQLELELARRNIPFVKYGGLKFLEGAHIKDVLCVLRWADNPRNRIAGFRAARILPGVGPATAARLLDVLDTTADCLAAMEAFGVPPASAGDWHAFVTLIRTLRTSPGTWPADMDAVVGWYQPHLQRIHEDAAAREGDLVQLQQIATTYASRERFLTELTLDPPAATGDEAGTPSRDDDYLILSTIHSAKGQEWKTVQILNVVDGCIPSDMSTGTSEDIEEERRLLYVAMTRARDHLHLIVPQRFYVRQQATYGDRHVYALRSRFIPKGLASLFQVRAWPIADPSSNGGDGAQRGSAKVDLAARARTAWL